LAVARRLRRALVGLLGREERLRRQKCVTEQMQMAADDARRLVADCQRITLKIAGALNGNSRRNTAASGGD
jgi:hypothetical protein